MQNSWPTDGNFSLFLTTDSNSLQVTDYVLWPLIKYLFLLPVLWVVQEAWYKEDLTFSQTQLTEASWALTTEGWQCWPEPEWGFWDSAPHRAASQVTGRWGPGRCTFLASSHRTGQSHTKHPSYSFFPSALSSLKCSCVSTQACVQSSSEGPKCRDRGGHLLEGQWEKRAGEVVAKDKH